MIIKSEAERIVFGEVYVPFRLDTDDEFMRPEEIRKAAHWFMENLRNRSVDANHDFQGQGDSVVESFLAKANDPDGFIEGSWIAATKINDDERWAKALKGELNGYSIAGKAAKIPRTVLVTALREATIKTEESTQPDVQAHTHEFVIKFDEKAKVVPTTTSKVEGHTHEVLTTTATEVASGHAHRFHVSWETEGVVKEEREEEVNELVLCQPKWLSLVQKAAIRRGFKVVKTEKFEDVDMEKAEQVSFGLEVKKMDRVVHAIIAKKGTTIDDLMGLPDFEWLADPELKELEMVEMGKSAKFVFMKADKFQNDSITTYKTKARGVKILAGILKEDEDNAVVLGLKDESNAETTKRQEDEMDEKRVAEMIDSAITEKVPKMLKDEFAAFKEELLKAQNEIEEEEKAAAEAAAKEAEEAKKAAESKKAEGDVLTKLNEIAASVAELKETQTKASEKTEELEKTVEKIAKGSKTSPGANDDDSKGVEKKDDGSPSPWSGFFTNVNNPKVAAILKGSDA